MVKCMGRAAGHVPCVTEANMQQRRFKLVVSEGSEGSVRGPVTLSRLLEEKAEVMVSSLICKPQKVKGMLQLGVVTVAQVVLVGSEDELTRLTGEYGDGSASSAVPGVAMSEWKNNIDSLTLSAGVDVRIGADGEAEFGKESSGCQGYLMAVNHMAAFCSELTEGIGDAHTAGLADNQGKTDELRQMARAVAESQVKVAKAELKQQKDLLDARLRALGEDAVEDAAEPEAEEPAEEEADEEEEEIDLIINVEVDKRGEEVHTEVRMKVSTLKKVIKKPTVTLLHALHSPFSKTNRSIYMADLGTAWYSKRRVVIWTRWSQ